MARAKPAPDEIPTLPPFPSTNFDVKVNLSDGTVEIIKVVARGPVAAFRTALYTAERWPTEKIALITSMEF
jgi:hypothetical protein